MSKSKSNSEGASGPVWGNKACPSPTLAKPNYKSIFYI